MLKVNRISHISYKNSIYSNKNAYMVLPGVKSDSFEQKQNNISFKGIDLSPEEQKMLVHYKGGSWYINAYLRGGEEGLKKAKPQYRGTVKEITDAVEVMDTAVRKYRLPEDTVVYRFTDDPKISKGMEFYTDKGFMNTCKRLSKVENMTQWWDSRTDYILKIKLPKGTQCIDVERAQNRYDEEAEVILPRDSKFKVTGFCRFDDYYKDVPWHKQPLFAECFRVVEMEMES